MKKLFLLFLLTGCASQPITPTGPTITKCGITLTLATNTGPFPWQVIGGLDSPLIQKACAVHNLGVQPFNGFYVGTRKDFVNGMWVQCSFTLVNGGIQNTDDSERLPVPFEYTTVNCN